MSSSPPPQKCNATMQELRDAGLMLNDVCPGCKDYKLELEVMFHRDAAAVPVPVVASGTSPAVVVCTRLRSDTSRTMDARATGEREQVLNYHAHHSVSLSLSFSFSFRS